eukprot:GHUV01019560.1.p1 GENE.GHUV01019560.1~~GHUV01019560.1.p1  ORF type:complete len:204 (+),score=34.71 GHUV01019560.1:418-1029(+)
MGGCREYTGAPFFSAMSALRMGCDLAYVFCTPDAAPVIKSYSPELIVLPALQEDRGKGDDLNKYEYPEAVEEAVSLFRGDFFPWVSRMSVLVIGPGLGDDPWVGECMYAAVRAAKHRDLPLIIDGSGINFVVGFESRQKDARQSMLELIQGYHNCILTPNIAEFGRLAEAVGLQLPGKIGTHWQQHVSPVDLLMLGSYARGCG